MTSAPCPYSTLMPPAAFVRIRLRTPARPSTRVGNTTSAAEYPSYKCTRPCITATGTSPDFPITSCPACPKAVERGKPGISAYGIRTASERSSANDPSPEPSTRPICGRNAVRANTKAAACSARSKRSPVISLFSPIHQQQLLQLGCLVPGQSRSHQTRFQRIDRSVLRCFVLGGIHRVQIGVSIGDPCFFGSLNLRDRIGIARRLHQQFLIDGIQFRILTRQFVAGASVHFCLRLCLIAASLILGGLLRKAGNATQQQHHRQTFHHGISSVKPTQNSPEKQNKETRL